MKAVRQSIWMMLKLICQDGMLLAAGTAPLLAGAAIRYLIPLGETFLVQYTGVPVLSPYYGLFDIFFASLSPVMFCFISAMVMLEEHDDHIDRYLFVTDLGQRGYFISRILFPASAAFIVTAALLPVFHLTPMPFALICLLSFDGTVQGILVALLVVSISSNKLEGMAAGKLASLIILGAVLVYSVPEPFCYIFSFLPSFWMGKGIAESSFLYLVLSAVPGFFWIRILQSRFRKKIC